MPKTTEKQIELFTPKTPPSRNKIIKKNIIQSIDEKTQKPFVSVIRKKKLKPPPLKDDYEINNRKAKLLYSPVHVNNEELSNITHPITPITRPEPLFISKKMKIPKKPIVQPISYRTTKFREKKLSYNESITPSPLVILDDLKESLPKVPSILTRTLSDTNVNINKKKSFYSEYYQNNKIIIPPKPENQNYTNIELSALDPHKKILKSLKIPFYYPSNKFTDFMVYLDTNCPVYKRKNKHQNISPSHVPTDINNFVYADPTRIKQEKKNSQEYDYALGYIRKIEIIKRLANKI